MGREMTAGERRVLINNLFAEATKNAMKKDHMRINHFVRIWCLLHCTKSEADDLIKPQGVRSKIAVPDSYVEDSTNAEFIAPASSVAPEEIVLGSVDLDI